MNADTEARKVLDELMPMPSTIAVDQDDMLSVPILAAYVRRLEQRIAAARLHIDRARSWTDSGGECAAELVMALDVLNGEAG